MYIVHTLCVVVMVSLPPIPVEGYLVVCFSVHARILCDSAHTIQTGFLAVASSTFHASEPCILSYEPVKCRHNTSNIIEQGNNIIDGVPRTETLRGYYT